MQQCFSAFFVVYKQYCEWHSLSSLIKKAGILLLTAFCLTNKGRKNTKFTHKITGLKMTKLGIVNSLLILLCLTTGILFVGSHLRSYSIIEMIDLDLLYSFRIGGNSTSALDSLSLRSLKDYLPDNPQNKAVTALTKQLLKPDSLRTKSFARLISVNGVPWLQMQNPKQRKQYIEERKSISPHKDTYLLLLEFRGKVYQALIPRYRLPFHDVFQKTIDQVLFLILILFPAISSAFRYRKLFICLLALHISKMLLFAYGQWTMQPHAYDAITQAIWYSMYPLLLIPIFPLLGRRYRFVPWVLLALFSVNVVVQSFEFFSVTVVIVLILAIIQERGVSRKFYLEFVYLLLIFLGYLSAFLLIMFIVKSADLFSAKLYIQWDHPAIKLMLNVLQAVPGLVIQVIVLLLVMLLYRMIRLKIKVLEKLFLYSSILWSTILTASLIVIIFQLLQSRIDWIWVLLVAAFVLAFSGARYELSRYPILNPVRFSLRDKTVKLLNQSYAFTDKRAYAEMFIGFIKGLNSSYRLAFYNADFQVGDQFPGVDYPRLEEATKLIPAIDRMLNIDIELLNDTNVGRALQGFDNKAMPHLLYPIADDNGVLQGLFAFGKMPGVYWQESLAKALLALVDVFKGFYLNMSAQEALRTQNVHLVQEHEARMYSEKLAEVTADKNRQLEEEKKLILDSIEYASLIQKSILPPANLLKESFPDNFVLWKPRDIVGGDLYWLHKIPDSSLVLFAVVDCTGHGVPGALMSVAANSALDRIVKDMGITTPALILEELHKNIGSTLHQESEKTQQDGMDISLIKLDTATRKITFAGAVHQLLVYRAEAKIMLRFAGNRQSIGGLKWKQTISFQQQEHTFSAGDVLYLYTDGMVDQRCLSDGAKLKRLGNLGWQEFLLGLAIYPLEDQKQRISSLLNDMLSHEAQRDDICVVGLMLL